MALMAFVLSMWSIAAARMAFYAAAQKEQGPPWRALNDETV